MKELSTTTKPWLDTVTQLLLVIGTWLSFALILTGGIGIIFQFGSDVIEPNAIPAIHFSDLNFHSWHNAFASLPHGIIEIGLLLLVVVQVLRVAVLFVYYIVSKDKWFIFISGFILASLLYSLFWQFT